MTAGPDAPDERPADDRPEQEAERAQAAPAPVRRSQGRADKGRGRSKKKGLPALALFLLFGAAPAAIAGWFFTRPQEEQDALLARLPEGTGGRALKAGICVAVLFGLARVALPAFHGTGAFLRGGLASLRSKPTALRILLFPVELVVWLLWFVVQILFAVDAVLIVAASVGTLVLVARILKPDLFESWLPEILK